MSLPIYSAINSNVEFLKGKTLVVPVVSVANIAQLAVDLLIASLGLKRIGILDSSYLIPVIGPRDDGEAGFTTPLELYGKEGLDVVFIQQRSPAMKEQKQEFVDLLMTFVRDYKIGALLLLAGVDLSNRSDAQMSSSTYKINLKRSPNLESTPLSKVSSLPTYSFAPAQHSPTKETSSTDAPFIPGGGLTRRILSTLSSTDSTITHVPTACILQFVLEGDNRGDAVYFARAVAELLSIDRHVVAWKQPSSWAAGLFGTTHDQSLYG
ncbi:hypothetical protein SCHPADRAFT_918582 [Schizopora paradoxa]|uniref:Proteasome assembly chaperone 2 n=1 Tax=Schizopora paradoxa TaxID=27342 RepID=A0A0H2S5K0_9AGAM|nr:hypothetical protein SCHPADRAFT_918582 [Schizopora paradoxa]